MNFVELHNARTNCLMSTRLYNPALQMEKAFKKLNDFCF